MVRAVTAIFGVAFLAVGVLGFILNPTGGELLGIFAVNVAHNLVHVAFGVLGIAAAYAGWSRLYLQGVGVIYLLLCVLGFIPGLYVGEDMLLGLVHINLADNFLHLVLAYFRRPRQSPLTASGSGRPRSSPASSSPGSSGTWSGSFRFSTMA